MRVIDIVPGTTVDGPGLRTSVYLAGCTHDCPGCHNPQTHDPSAGTEMTFDEILAVVEENGFDVTLTGGDPLCQIEDTVELARLLRERGYGLWCYTGYTYEHIIASPRLAPILRQIDVLVDGPFILAERDISLRFRGSRNQRLIDIPATALNGTITLYTD